jgi:molybdenum cofactor cytidylyltransferase
MGRPKALLTFQGETFLGRLQRIFGSHCDRVFVVLGYQSELLRPHLRADCVEVLNPSPERGMLSSLQAGLLAAGECSILFSPVDIAAVAEDTVQRVVTMPNCPIALPRFRGTRGHPVRISPRIAQEMLAGHGPARDVIRSHNLEIVYADVDDPGILADVDTEEDYAALQRLGRS